MALAINFTLLIQMAHFIGAYMLLTRFFLRPGYEAVKEDQESLHQVRTLIVDQQKTLAERFLYKHEQWKLCQKHFFLTRPALDKEGYVPMNHKTHTPTSMPIPSEMETIAREVSAVLKERVLHD
ncbi:hypothetical protein H0X06_01640 [Candidatus Dependentiae bacterium]|nr:hypothetical protein [Candidatus Dependentiae bacterium]